MSDDPIPLGSNLTTPPGRISAGPDLNRCLCDALQLVLLAPPARAAEHNRAAAEEGCPPVVEDLARDLGDRFARLKKNPDVQNWAHMQPYQFVDRVVAVLESVRDGPSRERWSTIRGQLASIQSPDDATRHGWFRQLDEHEVWLDPQAALRDLIRTVADGQVDYLKEPRPRDPDALTATVGVIIARQEVWQRKLAGIVDELSRDLQRAGKPAKEVHDLLEAVRRPLRRIMAINRLRNPEAVVAFLPGEEPADADALRAARRDSVRASRESMAEERIEPLREEALAAADVLDTAWRPLCARQPESLPALPPHQRETISAMESATPPAPEIPSYTLGDLIRDLEGSDHAYAQNKAVADRKAATSSVEAAWWYNQAAVLRWQPDPGRMPGIERIELICNRLYGTGITAESLRRLRAKLCDDHGIQLPRVADQLDLITVANIIEGRREVSFDAMQKVEQDAFHHGLMTLDTIGVGGACVEVTGLSCKVISGTTPTACPAANPAVPPSVLPTIDQAIRRFCNLPPGTTIHWVGHDTGCRSRCPCHPDAPYAAPFDAHRWGQLVSTAGVRSDNESTAPDALKAGQPDAGDGAGTGDCTTATTAGPEKGEVKGKRINERMLAEIRDHPTESLKRSLRDWADLFGCSPSTVKDTAAWATLHQQREGAKWARQMRDKQKRTGRS
jgi:hypothetical protein